MRRAILVDIDGTVAINTHRVHHLQKSPKDWDSFNATMHLDEPNQPVRTVVKALYNYGYSVIYCSARMEKFRKITVDWLRVAGMPNSALYLRADDDFRADAVVKREFLEVIRSRGFCPKLVIDDRSSVVAMWRAEGLLCLQPAPGDF